MTPGFHASVDFADATTIARAAEILRAGGLVAIPTETVYGLGADAANDKAIAAIFATKERPRFNPLIVHIHDIGHAQSLAQFSAGARSLAEAFWPGPLTLVLPRLTNAPISLLACAGLDTVALRIPAHRVARDLLEVSQLAIAAPSANRSGHVSPTTAAHVAESLGAHVDLILDAGPSPIGVESTVVGFDRRGAILLRPGALARDAVEAVVGQLRDPEDTTIISPGQQRSHYAPRTPLRLDAREVNAGEALLAFGSELPAQSRATRNLSPSGDLREAAGNLFAMLRELDKAGCARIAVMSVPGHGLGEAINDRLRRAAAPRNE
jgi:L-threonylcarbamoyladenylate synthase